MMAMVIRPMHTRRSSASVIRNDQICVVRPTCSARASTSTKPPLAEPVRAGSGESYPEMAGHGAGTKRIELGKVGQERAPDAHDVFLSV
jgi:hypothetical protein